MALRLATGISTDPAAPRSTTCVSTSRGSSVRLYFPACCGRGFQGLGFRGGRDGAVSKRKARIHSVRAQPRRRRRSLPASARSAPPTRELCIPPNCPSLHAAFFFFTFPAGSKLSFERTLATLVTSTTCMPSSASLVRYHIASCPLHACMHGIQWGVRNWRRRGGGRLSEEGLVDKAPRHSAGARTACASTDTHACMHSMHERCAPWRRPPYASGPPAAS